MTGMTRRIGGAQSVATRPLSALISAALLLLAGVSGVAGFAGPTASGAPAATGPSTGRAAVTTVSATTPAPRPRPGGPPAPPGPPPPPTPPVPARRSVTVVGISAGSRPDASGWAPHHPETADVPVTPVLPVPRFVQSPVRAGPAVVA